MENYALVRLYHPAGVQVSVPIDLNIEVTPDQVETMTRSIDNILKGGWTINLPGLEEGELVEEVNAVARREANDKTPIVAFYAPHPKLVKKFLHAYFNTPDDIAAFESAAGIKMDSIPVFDGDQFPDKDSPKASKYIVTLPHPVKIVWKVSPKWEKWNAEGKNGQEPQKRLIVRYENGHNPSVVADPVTGEVKSEKEPVPNQYEKTDGAFVNMLIKSTGLKPTVIMPILAKVPEKTLTHEDAVRIIKENLGK